MVRTISQIIIHPNYVASTFDNDVALLRLSTPVTLTTEVALICLPLTGTGFPDGQECVPAGWGTTLSEYRLNRFYPIFCRGGICSS